MNGEGLGSGALTDVTPLEGGTQNVLLRFERDGRTYVVRRGPPHLRPTSNDLIRREATILTALRGTAVPHPEVIASCSDAEVMGGAVFYLMEYVDGFNPTVTLPEPHASDKSIRRQMGLNAADAIAALGAIDHVAIGLESFGRPEGFIDRQVGRWMSECESYSRFEEYPGPQIPGLEAVAEWLEANKPVSFEPGIMHGDYHMANLRYSLQGPEVAAIVDWEMCTIGDPLVDLGWMLATWPDENGAGVGMPNVTALSGGLPSAAEFVSRYGERSERDLSAADWYTVLACFKLGIILEGTHARAFAGKAPKPVGDLLHSITLALFERAVRIIRS
ncbi:MAG: phosphotransferase family protein [Acidobacteria bacterium]|nr:MAG: phosphotransferase family protein [Acidobacteriota bacterium]